MEFNLTVAKTRYDKHRKHEMNEMKELEELDFTFHDIFSCHPGLVEPKTQPFFIIDDNDITLEINTLEQLMEFVNKYGGIVLEKDAIEIYNGYIE